MQHFIIFLIILIIVVIALAYYFRQRNFKTIELLTQEKNILRDYPMEEEFKKINDLPLAGESQEFYEGLIHEWQDIQDKKIIAVENSLLEAKEASDRFRFNQANQSITDANQRMESIGKVIRSISKDITDIEKKQSENQAYIEEVIDRYKTLRKNLLTHSFSFGNSLPALENELGKLEHFFSAYREESQRGDHLKARSIIENLDNMVAQLENKISVIPQLLQELDEVYEAEIGDLKEGQDLLKNRKIVLEDYDLDQKLAHSTDLLEDSCQAIADLNLEEAQEKIKTLGQHHDEIFDRLETEYRHYHEVQEKIEEIAEAMRFLEDRNHQFMIETDRMSQNYLLDDKSMALSGQVSRQIRKQRDIFVDLRSTIKETSFSPSLVVNRIEKLQRDLQMIYNQQEDGLAYILSLSDQEKATKAHTEEMMQRMSGIQRSLKQLNLPGLPTAFQELFQYETDRLKELGRLLSQSRLDIQEASYLESESEKDLQELEREATAIIDAVYLSEEVTPSLNLLKAENPELDAAIEESQRLFNEDYDYPAAYLVLRDNLAAIDPQALEEIENRYYASVE